MDVLAILLYLILSLKQGKIPYFTDIVNFSNLSHSVSGQGLYSGVVALLFVLDIVFLFLLFVSAWLFYKKSPYAVRFSFAQELFRLISFRCSIAFFPLVLGLFGVASAWVGLLLFCLSEAVKIGSLVYILKKEK